VVPITNYDTHLFIGLARSKTQLLSPLLKQNILPQAVVVLKFSI
jgi:hypothetical protein